MHPSLSVAALVLGCLAGCATTSATTSATSGIAPTSEPVVVSVPEVRIVASPVGKDALEVYDAELLFARGIDLLQGEAWRDAADYFERLLREFPSSAPVLLTHYNLGVAYLHLENGDDAVAAFDVFLAGLPEEAAQDRLDGRFKRGQALAVAHRYEEVAAYFDEMLGEDLGPADRIEALTDAGVGHFMRGDRYTAEYRFLEARRIHRQASDRIRLDVGYHIGQGSFYLSEVARLDFEEYQLKFPTLADLEAPGARTLESVLGEQLEEKCQRLLRAQYAYLRTIREGHAGWASAAGFKVGQMYEALHDELVALPPPPDLGEGASALYQQMMQDKVLVLLEKAVKTWQSNADMVTRTGSESEWAVRTRESLERVRMRILSARAARTQRDSAMVPLGASAVAQSPGARDAS